MLTITKSYPNWWKPLCLVRWLFFVSSGLPAWRENTMEGWSSFCLSRSIWPILKLVWCIPESSNLLLQCVTLCRLRVSTMENTTRRLWRLLRSVKLSRPWVSAIEKLRIFVWRVNRCPPSFWTGGPSLGATISSGSLDIYLDLNLFIGSWYSNRESLATHLTVSPVLSSYI